MITSLLSLAEMSDTPPRVLNISQGTQQLAAVNIQADQSAKLDYGDGHFVLIRVHHALDEANESQAIKLLTEWQRVLHRHGGLHLIVPHAQTSKAKKWLKQVGLTHIEELPLEEDLANYCNDPQAVTTDGDALLFASKPRVPHAHDEVLGGKAFSQKCQEFIRQHPDNPAASFIIAIYNEAPNLPHFLSFLESAENQTNTQREFIFVLNGCTDDSEEVLKRYLAESTLNAKVVTSGVGIVTAYIKGIAERTLNGFIGKLDADVILHPHLLDLLQMQLVTNPEAQVAYAEPMPVDSRIAYNESDHIPGIMSKRLYYTSKASLNRVDPFGRPAIRKILEPFKAEDMFLSFYFVYFYGLDSIMRTPHAHVYAKTVGNFDDLVKQIARMNSEMSREFTAYPPFKALLKVLEQEIYPSNYKQIFEKAQAEAGYVKEWTRIQSTK